MSGRLWTDEEIAYLYDHYHHQTAEYIGRKLGRTASSVHLKAAKLNIERKAPDLFTQNELAQILGVDHHWLMKLRAWGVLEGRQVKGAGRTHKEWRFREADIIAMLRDHGWLFDHDKIDPAWQQYHADRWISLGDAFRRGAAHLNYLSSGCAAGLVPDARKRGAMWVIPERVLPYLVECRRRVMDDQEHRRQLLGYERAQRRYEAERKVIAYRRGVSRGRAA